MKAVIRPLCVVALIVSCVPALQAQRLKGRAARPGQEVAPPPMPALTADAEAAVEDLSSRFAREVELVQGWFRDRPVLYYDFGPVPQPVVVGRVVWPIHGFDARGYPVAIRGQRPIFSAIPGLAGYSGLWRLSYMVTADNLQPNQVRDLDGVDAMVKNHRANIRESNLVLNLPIVPRGTRLARDTSTGMLGWYQGRDVQFFDFGPASDTAASMWRFVRGDPTAAEPQFVEGQNSVVDSIPVAPSYPDLWQISYVRTDSTFAANSVTSLAALQRSGLTIAAPAVTRNLPIVIVEGTQVQRVASPIRAFADLRSPFPPAPTRP